MCHPPSMQSFPKRKKKNLDPIFPSFWPVICLVLQKPPNGCSSISLHTPTHTQKSKHPENPNYFRSQCYLPQFFNLISNRVRSVFFTFKKRKKTQHKLVQILFNITSYVLERAKTSFVGKQKIRNFSRHCTTCAA